MRSSRALPELFAERQKLHDELDTIGAELPHDLDLEAESLERIRRLCDDLRAIDTLIALRRPRNTKEALAIALGPLACALTRGDHKLAAALRTAITNRQRPRHARRAR